LVADPAALGDLHLRGEAGRVTVHNPLATTRTSVVRMPVSVCNVEVTDADTNEPVLVQITTETGIPSTIAPYYDFELDFEVVLGPLQSKTFLFTPDIRTCGGGDVEATGRSAALTRHEHVLKSEFRKIEEDQPHAKLIASQRLMECAGSEASQCTVAPDVPEAAGQAAVMSIQNAFMIVYVSLARGLEAIYDKASKTNYTIQHELVYYNTNTSDAYNFGPTGPAAPVLKDKAVRAATMAVGPVMSEIRLQISLEHKTFLRIYESQDVDVGGYLEVVNEIGTLEHNTEVASRFTSPSVADSINDTILVAEENGYEKIEHVYVPSNASTSIPSQYYPSQMSVAIRGKSTGVQLSVALDRAKGVSTLGAGQLEFMHHRRALPYDGTGGTVVLNDIDRIHTEARVSIGSRISSNRQQVVMKRHLNYPLVLQSGPVLSESPAPTMSDTPALPQNVHLQLVRATSAVGDELVVRLQHLFSKGEDPEMSVPVNVDVASLVLQTVLGGRQGVSIKSITETSLVAGMPKSDVKRKSFKTVNDNSRTVAEAVVQPENAGAVVIQPFELRTFLVQLAGPHYERAPSSKIIV